MDDPNQIFENYKKHMLEEAQRELEENAELIQRFTIHCNNLGIPLNKEHFSYVQAIGIVAEYSNILNLLNTKVEIDKEGLVDFDILRSEYSLERFASGYLYGTNYIAMAHPYFRRGHHVNSNFAPRFIEFFWGHPSNQKYIALDFNRVRVNVDNRFYRELDTWYGADFKNEISTIPDGVVQLRPPSDLTVQDIDFMFGSAYSLGIKWATKDGVKVFYLEEFRDETIKIKRQNVEYYPARYVHAEFDLAANSFRHFDGAIHFYNEEEYIARRETDLNFNAKNNKQLKAPSQKLFKLNSHTTIDQWINLTTHFLQGNPLIFEYFEGKLPDRIAEMVEKMRVYRQKENSQTNI